jgi:hypothetical protein
VRLDHLLSRNRTAQPDPAPTQDTCDPETRRNDPRRPLGVSAVFASSVIDGAIAQLGEHLLCKQGVVGSIPTGSTSCAGIGAWRATRASPNPHPLPSPGGRGGVIVARCATPTALLKRGL